MRVLLLGFGKVGGAFCDLLAEAGKGVTIVGVATRTHGCLFRQEGLSHETIRQFRSGRTSLKHEIELPERVSCQAMDLIRNADYDVLIECIHSNLRSGEPALSFLRAGLERGAHVITSNKGPLIRAFDELRTLAGKKGLELCYESTVLAGTPLFSLVEEGLPLGRIEAFEGVLNGTSNYILDLMEGGSSFDEALRDAQRRGFTESDPLLDVEGWDSAAKAIVVAKAIMGAGVINLEEVPFEGIRQVTSQMLEEARRAGGRIRLVSRILRRPEGVDISVRPEILPLGHPLSSLSGAHCGAVVVSEYLGDVAIIGPGTGPRHVAYGLLRDLLALMGGKRDRGEV